MLDWFRLVRISGAVTVLTNLLAAVFTAFYISGGLDPYCYWLLKRLHDGGLRPFWVVLASLLLYATGMIWNDLVDVERDRALHPDRPLPAGRISLASAYAAGVLFAVGALLSAAFVEHGFFAAGVVLSWIFLYNLVTKGIPYLGSLTMALVRSSHALFALLLLGSEFIRQAVLIQTPPGQGFVLAYPLVLGVYVFGLTLISELESRPGRRWELVLGGGLLFAAILGAAWLFISAHWIKSPSDGSMQMMGKGLAVLLGVVVLVWLVLSVVKPWLAAVRHGKNALVGATVGAALGGMILLDALVASSAHPLGGLAVLLLLPVFILGQRLGRME
jgi:4-hydroxybenzoate polyprenyltransferase